MRRRLLPFVWRVVSIYTTLLLLHINFLNAEDAVATTPAPAVPGCPDLDILEKIDDFSPDMLDDLLLCFCRQNEDNPNGVAVQCLYGSTLNMLQRATKFIVAANKTIEQISFQHTELPDDGLANGMLQKLAPTLQSFEIRECADSNPLLVGEKAFEGLENTMINLTIHGCNLPEIPKAVTTLQNLEYLDVSDNKISRFFKETFENKRKLKYLDASANFINSSEAGAFENLDSLESIILGDHNYMNETIWDEIVQLKKLQNLDLSRADGIFSTPADYLAKLPQLKTLKMGGCSLESIEAGDFGALENLEQLDLRVNLIKNVSVFAFDGLKNLKRLSLAGNYIKNVQSVTFDGLSSLEELDLGWNELSTFPNDTFSVMANTLKTLNLRHNNFETVSNITGMPNLTTINLSDSEKLLNLEKGAFHDLPSLEFIDLSNSNVSTIHPKAFNGVADSLKKIDISHSQVKKINKEILENLPNLEELTIAKNPLICDDELGEFVTTVQDRYKTAAKESKNFLLAGQNETNCNRPYELRGEQIFDLKKDDFKPYSALLDTTTQAPTTTTEEMTPLNITQIQFPDLFIGKESNETLFKEDEKRPVYSVEKTDDSHLDSVKPNDDNGTGTTLLIILGAAGLVSILAVIAIAAYMIKKKQARTVSAAEGKKKPADDGMVEIELRSQGGSQRRSHNSSLPRHMEKRAYR